MWKVFEKIKIDGSQEVTKVGDESGWPIALVFDPKNAPLVAASPQLLAACYAALEVISHYQGIGGALTHELLLRYQAKIIDVVDQLHSAGITA